QFETGIDGNVIAGINTYIRVRRYSYSNLSEHGVHSAGITHGNGIGSSHFRSNGYVRVCRAVVPFKSIHSIALRGNRPDGYFLPAIIHRDILEGGFEWIDRSYPK